MNVEGLGIGVIEEVAEACLDRSAQLVEEREEDAAFGLGFYVETLREVSVRRPMRYISIKSHLPGPDNGVLRVLEETGSNGEQEEDERRATVNRGLRLPNSTSILLPTSIDKEIQVKTDGVGGGRVELAKTLDGARDRDENEGVGDGCFGRFEGVDGMGGSRRRFLCQDERETPLQLDRGYGWCCRRTLFWPVVQNLGEGLAKLWIYIQHEFRRRYVMYSPLDSLGPF